MNEMNDYFRRSQGYSLLDPDQGATGMPALSPAALAPGVPSMPMAAAPSARDQFNFTPTDRQQQQALWSSLARMGASMLANNRGPNAFASALGAGLGAQQEGYQNALQQSEAANTNALKSQMMREQFGEQQRQRTLQNGLRTALGQLDQNDPDYWGNVGRLYAAAGDMDTALKAQEVAGGGKPTDAIKNYKFLLGQGANPQQAAGVFTPFAPPNMQFVQGGDYGVTGVFNPRSGQFVAPPGASPNGAPLQSAAPVDKSAPWANLPPKAADEMKQRVYMNDQKKIDDMRAQVNAAKQTLGDLQRFGSLNRETGTGSLADKVLPPGWTTDADKQEMLAITSRLAPQVRPPGSGTTSDRDLALYLASLPGIEKPGPVNKAITQQFQNNMRAAENKVTFMENYFAQHGHLSGAEQAYQQASGAKNAPAPQARQAPPPRAAFGSLVSRDLVQQAADKAGMSYEQMASVLKSKGVRVQ